VLGKERRGGRSVAIKRVYLRSGSTRAAALREAHALAAIRHPNVVALLELHEEVRRSALCAAACVRLHARRPGNACDSSRRLRAGG